MTDRRDLLRGGVALTVGAWVAPSVLTIDRVAGASPSVPCEIPSVGGGASFIAAPPTIQEGTPGLDSNTTTWVWYEQGPVELAAPLPVNRVTAGTNFSGSSDESATIAANTWICSFYVHGDRLDDNGRLTGSLTFANSNIIGLIYRTAQLTTSAFLQAPTTTYFNAPTEGNDRMTLSLTPGANSLSWNMRFGNALDGIRVIVSCP